MTEKSKKERKKKKEDGKSIMPFNQLNEIFKDAQHSVATKFYDYKRPQSANFYWQIEVSVYILE